MRRLAAVLSIVAWAALPVCAQRHSSHGGSVAHSAPAFHASPSAPARSRSAVPPRVPAARVYRGAPQFRGGVAGNPGVRRGGFPDRHRRPYISPYRAAYPYAIVPWVGPGYLGYSGAFDSGDSQDASAAANSGYDDQGADSQPQGPWPALGPYAPGAGASNSAPAGEEAVTLIFKDGRPAEQIHNYMLTRTTLFVGDANRREIPLDQIDLTATANVNREAGIEFGLPQSLN